MLLGYGYGYGGMIKDEVFDIPAQANIRGVLWSWSSWSTCKQKKKQMNKEILKKKVFILK
jgi:hypothetical protein